MRTLFVFCQSNKIGEIAQQIYCVRNLCKLQNSPLTILIPDNNGTQYIANPTVFETALRGLDVVHLPIKNFMEQVKSYLAGIKEKYHYLLPFRPDLLRSQLLLNFAGKEPVYCFSLSEQEREQGLTVRGKMNIPRDAQTVTLHIREPGYFKTPPNAQGFLNANPENYRPAIEYLIEKGFYIIRLGDKTMSRMPEHPQIIDTPFHPDYHPIVEPYFCSESKFHFGMPSGPYELARAFHTPVLCVNGHLQNSQLSNKKGMHVYKKYYSQHLRRYLTYEEIQLSHIPNFVSADEFRASGIELIENTPQELLASAREMVARLDGVDPDYESMVITARLQTILERCHHLRSEICPEFPFSFDFLFEAVVGSAFFKMNPELLGVPISEEMIVKHYVNRQSAG